MGWGVLPAVMGVTALMSLPLLCGLALHIQHYCLPTTYQGRPTGLDGRAGGLHCTYIVNMTYS